MNISLQQLASALGGEISGKQILAPGPGHSPKDRSLSIRLDETAPDGFVVHSFSGDDPIVCRDHVRQLGGLARWEPQKAGSSHSAIARMTERLSSQVATKSQARPVAKAGSPPAEYIYRLADGTPYLRVKRPGFYQAHWDGTGWANGAPKGPKIPYRLPEMLGAEHDDVVVVEGEKDADNVAALGFITTTNSCGAEKFTADLAEWFKGKNVYVLPDNDEPGERHAEQVIEILQPVAKSIRVVRLPGLPDKGDVSDWIEAGGTADELAELLRRAPEIEAEVPQRLIKSSAQFLEGFTPPDYLIDGLVQRRFLYSVTAPTGHGKTAVALLISAHKALGLPIGKHEVDPGRVLYFAGENPDDVRMRWIALSERMGFDPKTIDVHFLEGTFKVSELVARIKQEVADLGGVSLIVVDTSAAYFEGDEENGNVQAGTHARLFRQLLKFPGEPCALILCHPVKNAQQDSLLPRGGGAFIAEVDGNLTCWKTDSLVTLHWQGKFRGTDFAPITFQLETVSSTHLRDSKGRQIPSVVAKALSDAEKSRAEASSRDDEDALLLAVADHPGSAYPGLAVALGWITGKGENKTKVSRVAKRLKADKLVNTDRRGSLRLSEKGETEVKRLRANRPPNLIVSS
ncbi:AAA family ATPase [Bradyrhizobium zhanjiangense]|uniref:Toprim domain-containing protein n=1 Tax=Bradyrhizobium zhanjiangense TaxID=1325107 RepID=A0A4Q0Q8X9_9BRAD|nr:AAA family ATPase [Bradyrhizobium zhanjiangense]RXG85350.1 toprim domain-containing protein [Bradyrhizobium zhanjiangense]